MKYSVLRWISCVAFPLALGTMLTLQAQTAHVQSGSQQGSSLRAAGRSSGDLPEDTPGHTHYLDYKDGFRGVRFGTSIDSFKDVTVTKDRGSIKSYVKKNEDLSFGEFKVDEIEYQFVNGKFEGVRLTASGADAQNLLRVFQSAFGPGFKPKGQPEQFFWTGKIANANFLVGSQGDTVAWIGNNELQKEYDKAFSEMLANAARKL